MNFKKNCIRLSPLSPVYFLPPGHLLHHPAAALPVVPKLQVEADHVGRQLQVPPQSGQVVRYPGENPCHLPWEKFEFLLMLMLMLMMMLMMMMMMMNFDDV